MSPRNYKSLFYGCTFIFITIVIIYGIQTNTVNAQSSQVLLKNDLSSELKNIFAKIEPSVVQITSTIKNQQNPFLSEFFGGYGGLELPKSSAQGSGFIYDNYGHIITNNHVISDADDIEVTFVDGNTYSAKVIGTDTLSDLAVLEIDGSAIGVQKILPVTFGDSSSLKAGEAVVAIGNPFGLSGSMTFGIISQTNRLLPVESSGFSIPGTIQIDAAINPGNSGGPLLNMNGEVIGITTAIFSPTGSFAGIGFSVPSNTIKKIIPTLISQGIYLHPWLGMGGVDITPKIAKEFGLVITKGVIVVEVTQGGPSSGILQKGDILVGIDGMAVRKIQDVITYIDTKSAGDVINLHLLVQDKIKTLQVQLSAIPT